MRLPNSGTGVAGSGTPATHYRAAIHCVAGAEIQAMSSSLHMAGSCGLARRCIRAHVVFLWFAGVRRSVERRDSAGRKDGGHIERRAAGSAQIKTGHEALWAQAQQLPDHWAQLIDNRLSIIDWLVNQLPRLNHSLTIGHQFINIHFPTPILSRKCLISLHGL